MNAESEKLTLPEGTTVLEELPRPEPSIELALEVARLGVSDEAIVAIGGEEALAIVRRQREEAAREEADGNGAFAGDTEELP